MSDETQRMELRITGRVQGVGFRNFTVRRAGRLPSVTGWVRNNADGSVSVVAEGLSSELDSLRDAVSEGPRMARVDSLEETRDDPTGEFESFRVRY